MTTPLVPLPKALKQKIDCLIQQYPHTPVLLIFQTLFNSAFAAIQTFDGYGFASSPNWNVKKVAGTACTWRFSLKGVKNAPRDSDDYRLIVVFTGRDITGRLEKGSAVIADFTYKEPTREATVTYYKWVQQQEPIYVRRR